MEVFYTNLFQLPKIDINKNPDRLPSVSDLVQLNEIKLRLSLGTPLQNKHRITIARAVVGLCLIHDYNKQ